MTKHMQVTKNIEYSEELMNYFIDNKIQMVPKASYVVFVQDDKELNKLNEKLLAGLIKEGKNIVKATKTNNKNEPWIFASVK